MAQLGGIGLFRISPPSGLVFVDEAATRIAGFHSPESVLAAGNPAPFGVAAAHAREPGSKVAPVSFEHEWKTPSGEGRRARVLLLPVLAAGGELEHFDGVIEELEPRASWDPPSTMALLESLLEQLPSPVFVKDESHRWLLLNTAFCDLMGRERGELIGKSDFDFYPPHEARNYWATDDAVFATGGVNENREQATDSSGRTHTIITRKTLSVGEHGRRLLLGVISDVTALEEERKLAEESLREQLRVKDQLVKIAESVPGVIHSYRLRPDGSACMPFAAPAIEDLFGISPDVLAKDMACWAANVHPDDIQHVNGAVAEAARTMSRWHDEYRYLHPTKGLRWIEGWSSPGLEPDGSILWHGYVTDVTERKWAENAQRRSDERYRALVTASSDVVYRMSPDWSEMHQLRGREFIADTETPSSTWLQKYIHPDDQSRVMAVIHDAIRTKGIFELEHRILHVDGSLGWVFSRAVPLLDANGEIAEWFGAASDVTERKQAEESIRQKAEALRRRAEEIEALMSTAPVAIWVAQDPACHTIQGNRTANAFYEAVEGENVSADPAPGLPVPPRRFFQNGREVTAAELPMQVAAARNTEVRDVEFDVEMQSGRRRTLWGNAAPLRDESGAVRGCVGTFLETTERRRAERAARETEQLYRAIGESIDYGVWVCAPDGRNTYASKSFLDLVGITQEQCSSFGWGDVLHPSDAERTIAAWKECVRTGATWDIEHRFRGVDGKWHPILARGVPVKNEQGEVVCWAGINLDISRIKDAEDRLRESEARFRSIFEQVGVGVAQMDSRTGRIVRINQKYCDIVGYSREEMLSRIWQDITHPDDRQSDVLSSARLLAGDTEGFSKEKRYLHRDGSTVWVNLTVSRMWAAGEQPGFHVAVVEDITARKEAEESLRQSEERFRALIENSTDMIVVLDAAMRVAFWSPSATEQLGWTAEEVQDRMEFELVHPDDRSQSREIFEGLAGKSDATARFVRRQLHRDGSSRLVEVIARNLLHDPSVRGVVANLRDITSQRQLEEQLLQSQKMEGIGRLAGGVAHDFNNILSVVLSYTASAMEKLREGDPLRDDLLEVENGGKRAAALTRQLLAFSRKQVLQPEPLDLNRIVAETEKMLHRIIGEDIDLVKVLSPDLGLVKADPGQIEQVLMNLAVNARDAMSEGGKLTIETANVELDADYAARHAEAVAGPHVMVAVSDSGVGMDETTLARVFEPFFTTKGPGKGSGLGLSTVYGIVRQSGGTINVYSEPGKGTTFKIYLPRELSLTPVVKEPAAVTHTGGTETVLLVEDDEAVRNVARRILVAGGYTVLTAANGVEALLSCEGNSAEIHLVLTDVVMPGMSGRDFFGRLAKVRPGIKVLYMSGYTDNAIVHHGVLEAGTQFMGKPFTHVELLRRTREVLDAGITAPACGCEQAVETATREKEQPLDVGAVRALPREVLERLRQAVIAARYEEIVALVETIRLTEPAVATLLRRMADLFDYDGLRDCIGE